MENYKLATKLALRFQTAQGQISTEQLWSMHLEQLDKLVVGLELELETTTKKSYLVKTSSKDKLAKLRFDIALDVLNSRVEEVQAARDAASKKESNKKITELIAKKQDESLSNLSVEELQKLLVD